MRIDAGYLMNFIATLYSNIRIDNEGNKIIDDYHYDIMEMILFPEGFENEET